MKIDTLLFHKAMFLIICDSMLAFNNWLSLFFVYISFILARNYKITNYLGVV